MKHCLQFWRANHDIQPSLTPYAMVEYMLACVTKVQKGMSAIMDKACKEVREGNMTLKESDTWEMPSLMEWKHHSKKQHS